MMCPDGKLCEYWFGADGTMICRHGQCSKPPPGSTAVDFCCPLELQSEHEVKKWSEFWYWWEILGGTAVHYEIHTQNFEENLRR